MPAPRVGKITLALTALALAAPSSQAWARQEAINAPSLILHGGRIHLMDDANTVVEAIAVRDGRVLAVGASDDILRLAHPDVTRAVDLEGRLALPGLIDGNIHGTRSAYYCWTSNIRIDFIADRALALAEVRQTAADNPPGAWLWTTRLPALFSINGLNPPGMFTRAELDAAAPDHPVLIMANGFGFAGQANSRALEVLGLKAGDPGVQVGEDGQPTGRLDMPALNVARAAISAQFENLTLDQQAACYLDFQRDMNRAGLTAYAGAQQGGRFDGGAWSLRNGGPPQAQLTPPPDAPRADPDYRRRAEAEGVPPTSVDRGYQPADPNAPETWGYDGNPNRDGLQPVGVLNRRGLLTTRITAFLDPRGGGLQGVKNAAYQSIGMIGDDRLRIGGLGPGFYMGQVQFGNTATMLPPRDYEEIIRFMACNRWNWTDQTYLEATVRFKLDVIERVNQECPIAGLRWTFEGIQEPIASASLDRIKALGMGVTTFATNIQGRSPLPDVAGPTPFGDLVRSGVVWCMSSDGVLGNPAQPFGHLWYAVSGQTMDPAGRTQPESQRLSRLEALRAKTSNCRFHLQNDRIGSLRPGDYADVVVPTADYFTAPEAEIRHIESLLTVVEGVPVFAQGAFETLDDEHEQAAERFRAESRRR